MASLRSTTSLLLVEKVNLTLSQFITRHIAHGGDASSLQASLTMATGQLYDRRTIKRWIEETL